MKALITGITGFAGSHLAELLLEENIEVFGTMRPRSPMENLTSGVQKQINLVECELRDNVAVRHTIKTVKPDAVFHLAAQSFVPTSWGSPEDTIMNNIICQLNIFEAVKDTGLTDTKIQIACSSEEYGMVYENEVPIRETNPLRPLSPYAVSKVSQDMMGYQYFMSYGLNVIRTRAFNHTGPRRGEIFVASTFAKQIASIEKGIQEPSIKVGNLGAKRDFTDVRDTVRAYYMSVLKAEPGEVYNIATNKTITIQELLDRLLALTDKDIEVKTDPARLRPSDVPILLGNYDRLRDRVGWEPRIPFDKTLEDLLNYWRERV
ncbi:MAG TPA: GDP-mannose 4,6-dehydratase [bacterium]|nr:GDP-mannose 4,6-dehydratase [bacterium]